MTRKIYQDDSYVFEFDSKIIEIIKRKKDVGVILEESAFYPESGGQLADRGTLNGNLVKDVQKADDEKVVHYLDKWDGEIGDDVKGEIDREWRMDNMRKHTGQHILSGVFQRIAGAATVSSHLGEFESTLEVDTDKLSDEKITEVELEANRIIMLNQPVETYWVSKSELEKIKVRRIPDREGPFRIVKVGEHDQTACGGTHLRTTGEVGLVKIISSEKIRGHLRFTFLTGLQALEDYREKNRMSSELSEMLTCHYRDFPDSVRKLLEQNSELRREVGRLNRELMPYDAEDLREKAIKAGEVFIIVEKRDQADMNEIKNLAQFLTEADNHVVAMVSGDRMIITVSKNVPLEAGKLAKLFTGTFGGKGGGNPALAQIGRIPVDNINEYLEGFVKLIQDELGN